MKTVKRYYLDYKEDSSIVAPSGATILEVEAEESGAGGSFGFLVWAEIDTNNSNLQIDFRILQEGDEFRAGEPASLTHVKTIALEVGRYKLEGYHIYLK